MSKQLILKMEAEHVRHVFDEMKEGSRLTIEARDGSLSFDVVLDPAPSDQVN